MASNMAIRQVKRGDCAWTAAKRNLIAQNKRAKNADIVKEMKRLAEVNGCKDVNEFNKKYFSRVNNVYAIEDNKVKPNKSRATNPINAPEEIEPTTPATPTPKSGNDVDKINGMKNDKDRIIEYNKQNYNGEYYGIIDKKSCKLNIYNKQGDVVKSYNVAVGKNKGDNINFGYYSKNKRTKEAGRYTTAGEFTLDEYKDFDGQNYISRKDGKHKIMALMGDNCGVDSGQLSIHMIPNHRPERVSQIKNRTNTRLSYGCVNITEEDYDQMHKYLGEGDKIYVLPEEKGNKLQLQKQKDGSYKFEQTYHKNDKRELSKEDASLVDYDVRPDKNPVYYA